MPPDAQDSCVTLICSKYMFLSRNLPCRESTVWQNKLELADILISNLVTRQLAHLANQPAEEQVD